MTIRVFLARVLVAITLGSAAEVQQSFEVVVPFVSRHGLVGGVAVAYVTIPVCGSAGTQANSELQEVPGSAETSIEKMGGPLHVFFNKQVTLTHAVAEVMGGLLIALGTSAANRSRKAGFEPLELYSETGFLPKYVSVWASGFAQ